MGFDDYTLLKIIGLIILFGPLPAALMVWDKDKRYLVYSFIISYVLCYILVVFLGIWVLIFYLPGAWYFALKPVLDKILH